MCLYLKVIVLVGAKVQPFHVLTKSPINIFLSETNQSDIFLLSLQSKYSKNVI